MIVMCAWCKQQLGDKPPYKDRESTHTICTSCLRDFDNGKFPVEANRWEMAASLEVLERKGFITKQEVLDAIQELYLRGWRGVRMNT